MEKQYLEKFYQELAEEIEVPETYLENMKKSYDALGNYIVDRIKNYKVSVYPQGSIALGTTIKPINAEDDYDIDFVCCLDDFNEDASELKNLVGDILKESKLYCDKLQDEGKRCWTIKYADTANYHVDILPSFSAEKQNSEIYITHKEDNNYIYKTSNPIGYLKWFSSKMELENKQNQEYIRNDVSEVQDYKSKTTLQKTIQILKRHRDIMFSDRTDQKPISIIITTLVANVYSGENNISDLILNFVRNSKNFIELDINGNYIIKNPVDFNENFADKWVINPDRKKAFFEWMTKIETDLVYNERFEQYDDEKLATEYGASFGNNTIEEIYLKRGKALLKKRENGMLYIDPLKKSIVEEKTSLPIKNHNFYGE